MMYYVYHISMSLFLFTYYFLISVVEYSSFTKYEASALFPSLTNLILLLHFAPSHYLPGARFVVPACRDRTVSACKSQKRSIHGIWSFYFSNFHVHIYYQLLPLLWSTFFEQSILKFIVTDCGLSRYILSMWPNQRKRCSLKCSSMLSTSVFSRILFLTLASPFYN